MTQMMVLHWGIVNRIEELNIEGVDVASGTLQAQETSSAIKRQAGKGATLKLSGRGGRTKLSGRGK